MADIAPGGFGRVAKLASLPAGVAGRAALGVGKRMTGKSKEEVNAELLEKPQTSCSRCWASSRAAR